MNLPQHHPSAIPLPPSHVRLIKNQPDLPSFRATKNTWNYFRITKKYAVLHFPCYYAYVTHQDAKRGTLNIFWSLVSWFWSRKSLPACLRSSISSYEKTLKIDWGKRAFATNRSIIYLIREKQQNTWNYFQIKKKYASLHFQPTTHMLHINTRESSSFIPRKGTLNLFSSLVTYFWSKKYMPACLRS